MHVRSLVFAFLALALLLGAGCSTPRTAHAELGKVTTSGVADGSLASAIVTGVDGALTFHIHVASGSGLTPGDHGVHIHAGTSCAPGPMSATNSTIIPAGAAGGHFNPESAHHGHHAGDLGNIHIADDGTGNLVGDLVVDRIGQQADLNLKEGSSLNVAGHALVIHAKADDLATDPSGNSGGRVLCGLIQLS